ncbi:MAG: hypothetical protein JWN32_3416, partial [Solirubrobacterales bacterium]|nr:hypothetical protein [Solirubrobacterales bacterium]
MAGAKVRWRESEDAFEVVDHGTLWFNGAAELIGPAVVAERASLTELGRALDRYLGSEGGADVELHVYDVPPEHLAQDDEMFVSREVSLEFTGRRVF